LVSSKSYTTPLALTIGATGERRNYGSYECKILKKARLDKYDALKIVAGSEKIILD
jgi:hypothetical protein